MAKITINVTGTDGFVVERSFSTADENVPAIVASYIADPSIPAPVDEKGFTLPKDAAWAVSYWMEEAVTAATVKAEQFLRNRAILAAMEGNYKIDLKAE